jgi:hypothetical protein
MRTADIDKCPSDSIVLKSRPGQKGRTGSFSLSVDKKGVKISGASRGLAQGCYYIEDMMSFARAPLLDEGKRTIAQAFAPRMIHSGYALDRFPDAHLSAITHAGMDAILVFVKGVNETLSGYLDFNELIYRAGRYGLDVYAYSCMESLLHPEDPGAKEYYENSYGRLFECCPGLKGVVLVGESIEFPSRDPRVSGKRYFENSTEGIPNDRPSPGWFPCEDYPQWLNLVKNVIRSKKSDADIVFWTYNWGYTAEKDRIRLIESLPTDISLMATFEMFEKKPLEDISVYAVDYTLSFPDAGTYFKSEAAAAKKRGMRLYTQACAAGLTWDIGVIPYEPCPDQWIRRYEALLEAREKHGLSGIMESHHFGFWPSFISLIEKYMFMLPKTEGELICGKAAEKEFGKKNVKDVLEAWRLWSEGITHYVSTNEDQYGPFRIGPAYPLVYSRDVQIPTVPWAHFGGNKICVTDYGSGVHVNGNPLQKRLPVEIRSLEKMLLCFKKGGDILEKVVRGLESGRLDYGKRMLNLGRYIERCVETTINVKRWNINRALSRIETDNKKLAALLKEMIQIGKEEIKNAQAAIPMVRMDSRLGYEPSMEYNGDEAHIQWKIRQVRQVIEKEIPDSLKSLEIKGKR